MSNRKRKHTSDDEDDNKKKKTDVSKTSVSKRDDLEQEVDRSQYCDCSNLVLKPDHVKRPLWLAAIRGEYYIYFEAEIFKQQYLDIHNDTYDFLIAIAEPVARQEYMQVYRLTENSLYAAVSISYTTDDVIRDLKILCKTTDFPPDMEDFIRDCTQRFGKAKLVLESNMFYIESKNPAILRALLKDKTIKEARSLAEQVSETIIGTECFERTTALQEDRRNQKLTFQMFRDDEMDTYFGDEWETSVRRFRIQQDMVKDVKNAANKVCRYPLMEEYDFTKDQKNPVLAIQNRPSTKIRHYQEKALGMMFGNGRARSGIIVLPCGAGKSLTGITAIQTIKRSAVIICPNTTSTQQWKRELLNWTNVDESKICMFTGELKNSLPSVSEACIVITTYPMMIAEKHAANGEKMIAAIKEREWGILVLDEVHQAPASRFQDALEIVKAHCKLGLTATLVREDDKIENLNTLVGPKLYEANWIDLTEEGFLAKALCLEVRCAMTKDFYKEYLESDFRKQKLLCALNPRKLRMCEYLVNLHIQKRDKIILFSDDIDALKTYCKKLNHFEIPCIHGSLPESKRQAILNAFKSNERVNVIGLSSVGDAALDIPNANVIIQVSFQGGGRRQEAQRLGRILRPKSNRSNIAFFYSLVSSDTREMFFSTKRQQYLRDQGYAFKVMESSTDEADRDCTILKTEIEEKDFLQYVIRKYNERDNNEELEEDEIPEGQDNGGDGCARSGAGRGRGGNASRRTNKSGGV